MPSTLYQRLKAARQFADLRQEDIARACGVGRAAVTLWESSNPDHRTRPSVEQIMKISQLTRVPVDWLMNDSSEVGDVWKIGSLNAPSSPRNARPTAARSPIDKRLKNFWTTVEFQIVEENSEASDWFGFHIEAGELSMAADYMHDRVLIQFGDLSAAEDLPGELGRILLVEKAAGRLLKKHLLLWNNKPEDARALDRVRTLAAPVLETFGITIALVSNTSEAVSYLTQHG